VSGFEGQIWTIQDNDELQFICTVKRVKSKIQALNNKSREQSIAADKLLWQHSSHAKDKTDWEQKIIQIEQSVAILATEVDVAFLWESALELELSELADLVDMCYGNIATVEHYAAIWQALAQDKLYFKRKGKNWEARPANQIEELQQQRAKLQFREQERGLARDWLVSLIKINLPNLLVNTTHEPVAVPENLHNFVTRLEAWLRGDNDKLVDELLTELAATQNISTRELAVDSLQKIGSIPLDIDRDVLIAGLKLEFSQAVLEAAAAIPAWGQTSSNNSDSLAVAFSIDDESTKEVDDALDIQREGELWHIIIAIADPESVVKRNDILDREAMRRGTSVYLPTQTILMLPSRISCDLASLSQQQIRSSIVVHAWLDDDANLHNSSIQRDNITVQQRLDYNNCDMLLQQPNNEIDPTAQKLHQLHQLAQKLKHKRIAAGALILNRREYKIKINSKQVEVELICTDSASHDLVSEMMILANHLAAKYAQFNQVPIIYRTQDPPEQEISAELLQHPLATYKIRKLLKASALSLHPGEHSGLGLSVYTQLSSPLRRFADLVMQRQLAAHTLGEPLPYDQEELFKVLATAERTAKEARRLENEAKRRWFSLFLHQSMQNQPLETLIVEEIKGGYKVEMLPWGVEAQLNTSKKLVPGQTITTFIDKIKLKTANIRLKLA
jgi:exoribonuclease II